MIVMMTPEIKETDFKKTHNSYSYFLQIIRNMTEVCESEKSI